MMKKIYIVKRVNSSQNCCNDIFRYQLDNRKDLEHSSVASSLSCFELQIFQQVDWSLAERGKMNCFPWAKSEDQTAYRPDSSFYVLYDTEYLYVLLTTVGRYEKRPRIREMGRQVAVHQDSCLEIFFSPLFNDSFFNFEFNAAGAYKIAYGKKQKPRYQLSAEELQNLLIYPLAIKEGGRAKQFAKLPENFDWGIFLRIPCIIFSKLIGRDLHFVKGEHIAANVYKCGDLTEKAHFGCWSPINHETPNFHLPEYFGEFIFD